jgi:hypothetical protein
MLNSLLDTLPIWAILPILLGLFAAAEISGAQLRKRLETNTEMFYSTSAAISLLALLIGFTFSVALGRYDTRRDLVIEEAAAITMMWQRTEMLAEPERDEMSAIIRQYVDERLRYFEANVTVNRRRAADIGGDALMDQMWHHARAMNEADERPLMTRALIDALTRVDDAAWRREAAAREHIPQLVMDLLVLFSVMTAAIIGYTTATRRRVNQIPNFGFLLLLTLAFAMVVDLDRPRSGLVLVSQQPMTELRSDLAQDVAARANEHVRGQR